jgi:hypothetical protein
MGVQQSCSCSPACIGPTSSPCVHNAYGMIANLTFMLSSFFQCLSADCQGQCWQVMGCTSAQQGCCPILPVASSLPSSDFSSMNLSCVPRAAEARSFIHVRLPALLPGLPKGNDVLPEARYTLAKTARPHARASQGHVSAERSGGEPVRPSVGRVQHTTGRSTGLEALAG